MNTRSPVMGIRRRISNSWTLRYVHQILQGNPNREKNQSENHSVGRNKNIDVSQVVMKDFSPFYEHKQDILRSYHYSPIFNYSEKRNFSLVYPMERAIKAGAARVMLRLCALDAGVQDDKFPPNIMVKVNSKLCPVESDPGPIDITSLCILSSLKYSNTLQITSRGGKHEYYFVWLYLASRKNVCDLVKGIQDRTPIDPETTQSLIQWKLKECCQSEVSATYLRCSLLCPLGLTRITLACRASTCNHYQCFDGVSYLRMNEKKATWSCPICRMPALYKDLRIDGYFMYILDQDPFCTNIIIQSDGTWHLNCFPLTSSCDLKDALKDAKEMQSESKRKIESMEVITIEDDDEVISWETNISGKKSGNDDIRRTVRATKRYRCDPGPGGSNANCHLKEVSTQTGDQKGGARKRRSGGKNLRHRSRNVF